MADTILTEAIHAVVAQPTVALMRTSMGLGTAALLSPSADVNTALGAADKAALNTAVTGGQALTPASVASSGTVSGTTGTFTGVVTVPAGTAGAPAIISTTGTADTGIWFPAADTVAASVAGVEAWRATTTGFGIGTTPGTKLHVVGDCTLDGSAGGAIPLKVKSNTSGNGIQIIGRAADHYAFIEFFQNNGTAATGSIYGFTDRITISDAAGADVITVKAGNAGVGTTTPGAKMDVNGTFAVTGASVLTGNLTANGALISTPQALSGAGAVNVTTLTTAVTTTAPSQALTLADGVNGQIKTIVHQALSGGGTWVLTPTTKTGYTTITSAAVGETCVLQFFTTIGWCILSLRGAVAA